MIELICFVSCCLSVQKVNKVIKSMMFSVQLSSSSAFYIRIDLVFSSTAILNHPNLNLQDEHLKPLLSFIDLFPSVSLCLLLHSGKVWQSALQCGMNFGSESMVQVVEFSPLSVNCVCRKIQIFKKR